MEDCKAFLRDLLQCFDASLSAYRTYISEGKTFRNACLLKINNERAFALLSNHSALLPDEYHTDANALADHYRTWKSKWENLAAQTNPGPDDEFVFPNDVTFPRESASRLENYYTSLI
ncbi:MAG TPA: hypothetical protein PLL23_00245 [Chitinophagaceae bacterium]|nr:hypothetical protein [Chitinophagaceae bacterium]